MEALKAEVFKRFNQKMLYQEMVISSKWINEPTTVFRTKIGRITLLKDAKIIYIFAGLYGLGKIELFESDRDIFAMRIVSSPTALMGAHYHEMLGTALLCISEAIREVLETR